MAAAAAADSPAAASWRLMDAEAARAWRGAVRRKEDAHSHWYNMSWFYLGPLGPESPEPLFPLIRFGRRRRLQTETSGKKAEMKFSPLSSLR